MSGQKDRLIAEEIQGTIHKLFLRIDDRFPGSGLSGVCQHLHGLSLEASQTISWISRPRYWLRVVVYSCMVPLAVGIILAISRLNVRADGLNIAEVIQMIEAALNGVVLISAGIIFLTTFEIRSKRKKVIDAINRLKSIAHIIDAHQLTKDPETITQRSMTTPHSPKRHFDGYLLSRYLDYCTEMLSLTSKLGFLYVQDFPDAVASGAVNELEDLTSGLAQQIWQKIMLIRL